MIQEWRSYRLKPGAARAYLALMADEGLPLVTAHLPLVGYWLAETGVLDTIHHLWAYDDWSEREAARAALSQDGAWTNGFIPKAFALVVEQENRLLRLERASPAFEAALSGRRTRRPAREAGAPLFAGECAGLLIGPIPEGLDIVAAWTPVSGDPRPLALLPRRADPLPPPPSPGTRHAVLRPLAFSPL